MGIMKAWSGVLRELRRKHRGTSCEGCGKKFLRPRAHVCYKKATVAEMDKHLAAAEIAKEVKQL